MGERERSDLNGNASRGRPTNITYELVSEIASRLRKEKAQFSCGDVLNEIGFGSMSTIHRLVKRWREEHPTSYGAGLSLSGKLLAILNAEIAQIVETAVREYKEELASARVDADQLCRSLAISQEQCMAFENSNSELRAIAIAHESSIRRLETEIEIRKAELEASHAAFARQREDFVRCETRLEAVKHLDEISREAVLGRAHVNESISQLRADLATTLVTKGQLENRVNELIDELARLKGDVDRGQVKGDRQSHKNSTLPRFATTRGGLTKTKFIISTVEKLLEKRKVISTPELLRHFDELGLEIGGKIPLQNLAAILSKSKKFKNSSKPKGWVLATAAGVSPQSDCQ